MRAMHGGGRWAGLGVLLLLFLSGCASSGGVDPFPTPTLPPPPRTLDLLMFQPGSSRSGAPGNTLMPAAAREGDVVVAAVDDYWSKTIRVAVLAADAIDITVVATGLSGDAYPEFLTVARFHNETVLAYRAGFNHLELQHGDARAWQRAPAGSLDPGTSVVSLPLLATDGTELVLGHAEYGPDGTKYRLHRLTQALDASPFAPPSRDLGAGIPNLLFAALAVHEGKIGVLYTPAPGAVAYASGPWGGAWSERNVFQAPPAEALGSGGQAVALAYDAEGRAWAVRTPVPYVGDVPVSAEEYRVAVAAAPDWGWSVVGVPNFDFDPYATVVDGRLLFIVRPDPRGYEAWAWDGATPPAKVAAASCRMRFVAHSDRVEAVALAYDPTPDTYRLVYVPDLYALGGADPCAPREDGAAVR